MPQKNKGARALSDAIFARGSRNFYTASIFFPPDIRRDITTLYAFVRTVDNFVDCIPQKLEKLNTFENNYYTALKSKNRKPTEYQQIITPFIELQQRFNFEQKWIDRFFYSMHLDIEKKRYTTIDEVCDYMFGSAEIVGLCILRIFKIGSTYDNEARHVGMAFQYINFIRDIDEDWKFGRTYLPLGNAPFSNLSAKAAYQYPEQFDQFIRRQIDIYFTWYDMGSHAIPNIPPRLQIAILTAGEIFHWIARRIYSRPKIVHKKRVNPPKIIIMYYGALHYLRVSWRRMH